MFHYVDAAALAIEQGTETALRERRQYDVFFAAAERYASQHGLVIGGREATRQLLRTADEAEAEGVSGAEDRAGARRAGQGDVRLSDYRYEFFTDDPRRDGKGMAQALWNAFEGLRESAPEPPRLSEPRPENGGQVSDPGDEGASRAPPGSGKESADAWGLARYVETRPSPTGGWVLRVNMREICRLLPLARAGGPSSSAADLLKAIVPADVSGLFAPGARLRCLGAELRLIDTYRDLCNPVQAKAWLELRKEERRLRELFLVRAGEKIASTFRGLTKHPRSEHGGVKNIGPRMRAKRTDGGNEDGDRIFYSEDDDEILYSEGDDEDDDEILYSEGDDEDDDEILYSEDDDEILYSEDDDGSFYSIEDDETPYGSGFFEEARAASEKVTGGKGRRKKKQELGKTSHKQRAGRDKRSSGGRKKQAARPSEKLERIIVEQHVLRTEGRALVGPRAYPLLARGRRRLQWVATRSLKHEERAARALAGKMGLAIESTNSPVRLPGAPWLRRLTLYVRDQGRRVAFADVYNVGEYELVPCSGSPAGAFSSREKVSRSSNTPLPRPSSQGDSVAHPYVQAYILLVDFWTLRLLMVAGSLSPAAAKQELSRLVETYRDVAAEAAKAAPPAARISSYVGRALDPVLAAKRHRMK